MKEKKVEKDEQCDCVKVTYNCFYDDYQLKGCPVIYTELSFNLNYYDYTSNKFMKNVLDIMQKNKISVIDITNITPAVCLRSELGDLEKINEFIENLKL
jgi:hypothetical protein